jgi:hypothetical protein
MRVAALLKERDFAAEQVPVNRTSGLLLILIVGHIRLQHAGKEVIFLFELEVGFLPHIYNTI